MPKTPVLVIYRYYNNTQTYEQYMLLFNAYSEIKVCITVWLQERWKVGRREGPMRPKTRGLNHHGGPPGWLVENDPAGVILYVMDGPSYRTGCPDRSWPAASCWNFQLLLYRKCTRNHPSWAPSCKEGMAWTLETPAFSLGASRGGGGTEGGGGGGVKKMWSDPPDPNLLRRRGNSRTPA